MFCTHLANGGLFPTGDPIVPFVISPRFECLNKRTHPHTCVNIFNQGPLIVLPLFGQYFCTQNKTGDSTPTGDYCPSSCWMRIQTHLCTYTLTNLYSCTPTNLGTCIPTDLFAFTPTKLCISVLVFILPFYLLSLCAISFLPTLIFTLNWYCDWPGNLLFGSESDST